MALRPAGAPAPVLLALRWTARAGSILMTGVLLLFALGEGSSHSSVSAPELLLFAFFPIGVFLGMAVAWWWERLGGSITVAALAGFYLMHHLASSRFPSGLAFVLIAAPGFFFLAAGLLSPRDPRGSAFPGRP